MPTINEMYRQAETGGDEVEVVPEFDRGRYYGVADQNAPSVGQMQDHNVSVFAECVRLRAERMAGAITGEMPGQSGFDVKRRLQDGSNEATDRDFPWRVLLRRPNPGWSGFRFWRWMHTVKDLQGHAEAIIERDEMGVPTSLWPVYPDWGTVRKRLDKKGGVDHYVFLFHDNAEEVKIEGRNLIRIEHPDPVQGGETQSLLERAAYELDTELESKEYERNLVKDGRPPSVYIKQDGGRGTVSASTRGQQEDEERMRQGHMGRNAYKVPVLSNAEFASIGLDPSDMQMLEARQMRKDDIFTITGVPPALYAKDPTNANVEAASKIFATKTLQPLAISTASTLTQQLERAFQVEEEGRLTVQAPNVVPVDETEQEQINQQRIKRGVPPQQVMEDQGEDVPEGQEEELARSYLPKGLQPAGQKGLGGLPAMPEDDEDRTAWELM